MADSLLEVTGRKGGAIAWDDGTFDVARWGDAKGLPVGPGTMSLLRRHRFGVKPPLIAEPCEVPGRIVRILRDDAGVSLDRAGFRAWRVTAESKGVSVVVVVHDDLR